VFREDHAEKEEDEMKKPVSLPVWAVAILAFLLLFHGVYHILEWAL